MTKLTRRGFIQGGLGVACSAAAAPLLTPVTVAAAPGENRLVVIILRGAMDGLGVFAPYGDPNYARLRPSIAEVPGDGLIDLDGHFGMDKRLKALAPLWRRGELAVAHAVSTPYRDKRSHFDGQDLLEAGVIDVSDVENGWLNRAVSHMPGATAETTLSVGASGMLLTRGQAPFRSWAPDAKLALEADERNLLQMIYAKDPLFMQAAGMAADLSDLGGGEDVRGAERRIAQYAADRLAAEARIAAFSIGGWDTHARQRGALNRPLKALSETLTVMHETLGAAWGRTLVVAMTEFGRTARENGNLGTDHGTGGAAVLAGGALKGAAIYGRWPGIAEADLYAGRDLAPTTDVRHYPAWALSALYGVDRAAIERDVFPGLDMGARPAFIA